MQTTTSGTPRIDVRVLRVDGIDPKGLNRTVRSKVQTAIRRDMGFGGQLIASWETDIKRSRIRSHQIVDEDGDTETTVKEIRALFGTQPIQSTE